MIKTFVVMLSPDSNLTPSMLMEKVASIGGVDYKETCYGLLIEGEEENLERAMKALREMDPNRIFFKVRGYRIGDERICRAKRGGGPRPGYFMLGAERKVLKNVSKALEAGGIFEVKEREPKKKLDVSRLKKIVEEEGDS
ncbi:MAG: methanogenesis marker 6 protein [Candidatus Methanomethyliaceae archaeon]|nr:methanogenesis marker 6 protein [Candidatus Methanomethyliaceae archaeon]